MVSQAYLSVLSECGHYASTLTWLHKWSWLNFLEPLLWPGIIAHTYHINLHIARTFYSLIINHLPSQMLPVTIAVCLKFSVSFSFSWVISIFINRNIFCFWSNCAVFFIVSIPSADPKFTRGLNNSPRYNQNVSLVTCYCYKYYVPILVISYYYFLFPVS